ncbi:MAG: DUF1211 domain-containing protein [Bacteroidetes bacterium]|nr:DUF1211 domain-containing protein [Bacteroidota bacterium]MBS1540820.1 DUF1211 domain-containing protein [Bacteroidota bacterium]
MKTGRLEAFSDGVLAIVITIMVLEFRVPEGSDFATLKPLIPKVVSYILSFIYVGIYWNNHHHLFHAIEKVNGKVMWANLVLLFALSLIPFTTAWMGENHFDKNPVALYGLNLLLCATAFTILEKAAIRHEGKESTVGIALKSKIKEYASVVIYLIGLVFSFWLPAISLACYVVVAIIWLIPDRRIEKQMR